MSDEAVIERFTGDWTSDGTSDNTDPTKSSWFPDSNMKMKCVKEQAADGSSIARIVVQPGGSTVPHADALKDAEYRVDGFLLRSTAISLDATLTVIETLSLNAAGDEMTHTVHFSDGIIAKWTCRP